MVMRTETLAKAFKALTGKGNKSERLVEVRLNGKTYSVSHIEHKAFTDVIVAVGQQDGELPSLTHAGLHGGRGLS